MKRMIYYVLGENQMFNYLFLFEGFMIQGPVAPHMIACYAIVEQLFTVSLKEYQKNPADTYINNT